MPNLPQEPILTVRDLLVDNWNPANTSTVTPRIHTGWFNDSWSGINQVTVTEPRENSLGGGVTGFRGQDGAGNPSKLMLGRCLVAVWAHEKDNSGVNPSEMIFQLSEEVRRIIRGNTFPGQGLNWLSWLGRTKRTDVKAEPELFRYDNEIAYLFEDRV